MGHHTWGDVWWPLWGPCEIWVRTTDFFDKLQKVGTLWEQHHRSAQWSMPPKSWRLTVKWSAQLFIGISFHANKDLIGNWPNWDQLVIAVPQCRGTSSLSHFSSTTIIIIHTASVNNFKIKNYLESMLLLVVHWADQWALGSIICAWGDWCDGYRALASNEEGSS